MDNLLILHDGSNTTDKVIETLKIDEKLDVTIEKAMPFTSLDLNNFDGVALIVPIYEPGKIPRHMHEYIFENREYLEIRKNVFIIYITSQHGREAELLAKDLIGHSIFENAVFVSKIDNIKKSKSIFEKLFGNSSNENITDLSKAKIHSFSESIKNYKNILKKLED